MQQFLGVIGLFAFFTILFFLPETSHPNKRGIDNVDPSSLPKWRPVILNPLKPILLLRSPNLIMIVRISLLSAILRAFVYIIFGIRLPLVLPLCSLIMVCEIYKRFKHTVHDFLNFSITGTGRIHHCKFAQLKYSIGFELTSIIT